MKKLSLAVTSMLQEQGIIEKEDMDACSYGLELAFLSVLEVLSILLLAIFVGNFLSTVIFFISFVPLRIYAGGYHADTRIGCYIILLVVYAAFSVLIKHMPVEFFLAIEGCVGLFTVFMVWKLAPIIHQNKLVNEADRCFYRKCSLRIVFVLECVLLAGMIWNAENTSIFAFSLGQFAVSVSMLAAFVKNKRTGGETNEKVF